MASDKKSAGKHNRVTLEVDPAWLEDLPEEEKPPARKRSKRPPSVPRAPKATRRDTIQVKSEWLMPPLPEANPPARRPARPPPLPQTMAKPRGKLPPPLPREEPEEPQERGSSSKRPARPSKRPSRRPKH